GKAGEIVKASRIADGIVKADEIVDEIVDEIEKIVLKLNSLIETEPFQMDTILLLVEDDAPQNTSNKSDLEDHEN
ncbi:20766_t:CDS:2, partial [Gigaspora margarita]